MRASLLRFIDANWYGSSRWTWLLLPLAAVFALGVMLRRLAFARGLLKAQTVSAPVIVVGNISVGGTGKSPIVAYLAIALRDQGRQPGIISRGYGGSPARKPVLVDATADPAQAGDEPVMLAQQTGCPVCVCIDRVAAAHELIRQGVDVVISDDGLQHYRLQRDMEIVVVDAERGLGNRCLLPAGPLREPASRLRSVDLVLFNGAGPDTVSAGSGLHFVLQAGRLCSLNDDTECDLSAFLGRRVWMVAGIGNPERFARTLEQAQIQVDRVPVPDHGSVDLAQLRRRHPQPILMTEKDAVKYRVQPNRDNDNDNDKDNGGKSSDATMTDCWYMPVRAVFAERDAEAVLSQVNEAIAEHAER